MNQEFVLGRLSEVMGWDDEVSRKEFAWLRLMSRMKYDSYQDYLAGMRFIECLTDWLQQFKTEHREAAYSFVRRDLVFVSAVEMQHLVELFYPETVQPRLLRRVAEQRGVPPYQVWSDPDGTKAYEALLKKSLFIELSDGGRIDVFRRANEGVIHNEQVLTAPRINEEKWQDLLKELRERTGNKADRFEFVFLVDDFTASGTSLLRIEDGKRKGKLARFWDDISKNRLMDNLFEESWTLCIHHYISTTQSKERVQELDAEFRRTSGQNGWFKGIELTSGMVLEDSVKVGLDTHPRFAELIDAYYDAAIVDKHIEKGGGDARFGFGKCALPLILDHNTPNNSIALLWAETTGDKGAHPMRPLFRRRQRHS